MRIDTNRLRKMRSIAERAADMHRYAEELREEARELEADPTTHDSLLDLVDVDGVDFMAVAENVERIKANKLLQRDRGCICYE